MKEEREKEGEGDGGDCVRYLLSASSGAESDLSWLLAHVMCVRVVHDVMHHLQR